MRCHHFSQSAGKRPNSIICIFHQNPQLAHCIIEPESSPSPYHRSRIALENVQADMRTKFAICRTQLSINWSLIGKGHILIKRASLAPVSQADHCSIDLASVALHFDQCCSSRAMLFWSASRAAQCCFLNISKQLCIVLSWHCAQTGFTKRWYCPGAILTWYCLDTAANV